jgi:hypothetical protein
MDNMNLPVYIFMSVIVGIFMGLTGSAEEIISDRKILKREAFLDLSWSGYLLSKVAVLFLLSAIQAFTFVLVGNTIMEVRGMYFEYWLVLFSAWACSNVMGLLISDSFKTVVTIYILIPFLVIPQIILSGIIVKYENLNPQISSPKRIPFYGEIMSARWAYEGLATYQFINNDYRRHFYPWEKVMSNASFKSNFHIRELQNKLALIERDLENGVGARNPAGARNLEGAFALLRNEIRDEYEERMILHGYYEAAPTYFLKEVDELYPGRADDQVLALTEEYLQALKDFYSETYRVAHAQKNRITEQFDLEVLQQLKRVHSNDKLEEFVTNKNVFERITEYRGNLIQKYDPIYSDPTHPFIKAHFYAPRKMVFGSFIPTIWVNVIVIWFMTLVLYILLYYRVLKRILDHTERIMPRRKT